MKVLSYKGPEIRNTVPKTETQTYGASWHCLDLNMALGQSIAQLIYVNSLIEWGKF